MGSESHLNGLWAALLVEELARNGVETFCVSPGSRSTPLTLAVAENERARSRVHFDERGLAYYALAHGAATGLPAALICTSGTAVANYLPAVAEASKARVPLIVLSADRPPELLDTGANQTIEQTGVFERFARWRATLPCPTADIAPEVVLTATAQAVHRSRRAPAGPVHLDCMFREPLAPTEAGPPPKEYLRHLASWETSGRPYTEYTAPRQEPAAAELRHLLDVVNTARKGLLIIGELREPAAQEAALALAQALQWPVFADATSGLRRRVDSTHIITNYGALMSSARFLEFLKPDAVLQLGGPVVCEALLRHLKSVQPATYVHVAEHPFRHDPFHQVSHRVEADIPSFCAWLSEAGRPQVDAAWVKTLHTASMKAEGAIGRYLGACGVLTEPGVARFVAHHAPEGSTLFIGNSMPIRDVDRFGGPTHAGVRVFANRGASGIEGNLAAAAGYADALGQPVTALIGDLALLHDLNSLALLGRTRAPVTLVVLNNNGGGIFHFLPIAKFDAYFEEFFATPHGLAFEKAADMFHLSYSQPAFVEDLTAAYSTATGPTLIEVRTNREENARVHKALSDAVDAALA